MLLIGYGNAGRGDDGLGPAFAERIEAAGLPGVDVDIDDVDIDDDDDVGQAHAIRLDRSLHALLVGATGARAPHRDRVLVIQKLK